MPILTEMQESKSEKEPTPARIKPNTKSGVILPVARIYKQMKTRFPTKVVSTGAALQCALGLEDLLSLVIEEAVHTAREGQSDLDKEPFVKPRHILFNPKLKVKIEDYLAIS